MIKVAFIFPYKNKSFFFLQHFDLIRKNTKSSLGSFHPSESGSDFGISGKALVQRAYFSALLSATAATSSSSSSQAAKAAF